MLIKIYTILRRLYSIASLRAILILIIKLGVLTFISLLSSIGVNFI